MSQGGIGRYWDAEQTRCPRDTGSVSASATPVEYLPVQAGFELSAKAQPCWWAAGQGCEKGMEKGPFSCPEGLSPSGEWSRGQKPCMHPILIILILRLKNEDASPRALSLASTLPHALLLTRGITGVFTSLKKGFFHPGCTCYPCEYLWEQREMFQ